MPRDKHAATIGGKGEAFARRAFRGRNQFAAQKTFGFHRAKHWVERSLLEGEPLRRFRRELPSNLVAVDGFLCTGDGRQDHQPRRPDAEIAL